MFKRQKSDKPRKPPIATHPAFHVIVPLWLAALCGLGMLVWTARPLLSFAAALVGGAIGFAVARFIAAHAGKQQANEPASSESIGERNRKIAPEPIAQELPSTEDWDEREPEILDVAALGEPLGPVEPQNDAIAETVTPEPADIVREEPELDAADKVTVQAEPESAADILRSHAIADMSLVQLIERFALSLDEYREQQASRDSVTQPNRPDPALVEALRMLPLLTGERAPRYASDGNAALALSTREEVEATERALREALAKLEQMSGG